MSRKSSITIQIKSLNNQIKRLLERTAIKGNEANLTGVQYAILGFISDESEIREIYQRDIETEFNIRRSTVSELLRVLEKDGYVRKEGVAGDARLKRILLTEKAKRLNKEAKQHINNIETRLLKGITEEEITELKSVLNKIKENAGSN